ncbi:tetratricopeptide repeat protein [Streptomyces sp. NPDC002920]
MSPRTNDGEPEHEPSARDTQPTPEHPSTGRAGDSADTDTLPYDTADGTQKTSAQDTPAHTAGTDAEADADAEADGDAASTGGVADADGPAAGTRHSHGDHHHDDDHGHGHGHDHDHPGSDVRIDAVRRVAAAGRRWRAVQLGACAAMLAVGLTAGAIAIGAARDGQQAPVVTAAAVSPGLLASGDLDASIKAMQAHLRAQPRDFGSWATLGLAYVEQARTKGDPSRYPQAAQALKKSLAVRPDNDEALAGQAALAAARHQFAEALKYADRALEQNPYSERALCSRIDALVELGRYEDAEKAANLADQRRPGVPVFTRFAYVHELRGDVTTARRVLNQALSSSTSPGDISYVASQLGLLAWNQGEYDEALTYYARALAADDTYLPALEGRARAQAASGRQAEAIKGLESVVARYPLPGPLVELGELYQTRNAKGDQAKAEDQYTLVDAWTAIARANGVNADLDTALAAADHGDKATALRAARDDWSRRHTVHTADALAWALHVNGKDAEALPYARQATATGYRNASFLYHRGVIEKATGHPTDARTHLSAALKLNAGFSPLGAAKARTELKTLEADQ